MIVCVGIFHLPWFSQGNPEQFLVNFLRYSWLYGPEGGPLPAIRQYIYGIAFALSGLIPYKIYKANCEFVKFWSPKFVT